MKHSINKFKQHSISASQSLNLKGGYSNFCEWYLGLCNGDETAKDLEKALKHMMKYDEKYMSELNDPERMEKAWKKIQKYLGNS